MHIVRVHQDNRSSYEMGCIVELITSKCITDSEAIERVGASWIVIATSEPHLMFDRLVKLGYHEDDILAPSF